MNDVLERFRSAVGLLLRHGQISNESLCPSENIKLYLLNTG